MIKSTELSLSLAKDNQFMYYATPILEGTRKQNSIQGFLNDSYQYFFGENLGIPAVLAIDRETNVTYRMIDFTKRVNHQIFGKNFASGKCVLGIFSNSWHKKTKAATLSLFESEVDFEDLYHFDFDGGKYVPEFSIKQNWMHAYMAAKQNNVHKALDYAMSQPKSPQWVRAMYHLRNRGLVAE